MTKTTNKYQTKSFDFDPNISVFNLLQRIEDFNLMFVKLNPQYGFPLPSVSVFGKPENILKFEMYITG